MTSFSGLTFEVSLKGEVGLFQGNKKQGEQSRLILWPEMLPKRAVNAAASWNFRECIARGSEGF